MKLELHIAHDQTLITARVEKVQGIISRARPAMPAGVNNTRGECNTRAADARKTVLYCDAVTEQRVDLPQAC